MDERPGAILSFKTFLSFINRLLVTIMAPTQVLLPGKSHGWWSLVGCSPLEESDTTERLHFHFSLSRIGEGNGNPLQYSCLENPRDRGVCWAVIYGVAQSQTRLTRLSSRSSPSILNPLPPPSSPDLSGLFQSTGFGCPASCIQLALIILFYIW